MCAFEVRTNANRRFNLTFADVFFTWLASSCRSSVSFSFPPENDNRLMLTTMKMVNFSMCENWIVSASNWKLRKLLIYCIIEFQICSDIFWINWQWNLWIYSIRWNFGKLISNAQNRGKNWKFNFENRLIDISFVHKINWTNDSSVLGKFCQNQNWEISIWIWIWVCFLWNWNLGSRKSFSVFMRVWTFWRVKHFNRSRFNE